MDQGILVGPFLLLLIAFALFDARLVFGVWSFTVLGMPTLRSKLGPVSVYWCDVAAVVACFAAARWPATETSQRLTKWFVALGAVYALGVATSILRYEALLEPGYEAMRDMVAFLPLVLLPRLVDEEGSLVWFWRGVVVAALWMAVAALIQVYWRDMALQLESFLYGARSVGSQDYAYRERAILTNVNFRAHGMYATSTCFAGAAVMTSVLLLFHMSRARATWLTWSALIASAVAMLLTYSRHGLLAWALLLLPLLLRRSLRGAILPALLVVSVLVLGAGKFWVERLGRGGVSDDENLSSRLVDRPLELLQRIEEEPVILLSGVGLGTDHIERADGSGPSREGFVSNSFALYLFYLGIPGGAVVVALLGSSLLTAWRLEGELGAVALGGLGAAVVIIASDNYAFLHQSFPFMWATVVALVQSCAEAQDAQDLLQEADDAAAIAH